MNKKINNQKGFIALLSLLIVSTVSMFFALSILMDGVANAALSLNSLYYEDARINIHTCIEDVLMRLKLEQQFNSPLSYTVAEANTCSTVMTWFAPNQVSPGVTERLVNVLVTGVSHNFTRHFLYELRQTRYDVHQSDGSLDYMNTLDYIAVTEQSS
jgi:hypothetical protein